MLVALKRYDLGSLIPKLDQVELWDKELSLGEQERLAFARLLLHKPGWIFLDTRKPECTRTAAFTQSPRKIGALSPEPFLSPFSLRRERHKENAKNDAHSTETKKQLWQGNQH
ncbi:hypothetical protein [Bradyrhizobium sp. AUGA SZCCT0283]|uniref:hypothetical protein n=1 Tax=Bradyrhizobium sp. AUGA SZCCT0283 TaxID=2807671 RepID=UPI001BA6BD96|nr:hypothetical protein [Bradyrhizobium sp. AUGA SZCCT0283]MBR1279800.1 hypothetical protein [Bradyrhizobium sp. AUGA SZCCT0283]